MNVSIPVISLPSHGHFRETLYSLQFALSLRTSLFIKNRTFPPSRDWIIERVSERVRGARERVHERASGSGLDYRLSKLLWPVSQCLLIFLLPHPGAALVSRSYKKQYHRLTLFLTQET